MNSRPAGLNEENKRLYDALQILADHHWRDWDHKTRHEWRLSFGIWGSLLAAMAALLKSNVRIPLGLALIIGLVIIGAHTIFLLWIRKRLVQIRASVTDYQVKMSNTIGIDPNIVASTKRPADKLKKITVKFWEYGSQITQFLITLFLSCCLIWLTTQNMVKSDDQEKLQKYTIRLDNNMHKDNMNREKYHHIIKPKRH